MSGVVARAPAPEPPAEMLEAMAECRDRRMRAMAEPLLARLGPKWMRADQALERLNCSDLQVICAAALGLVECRPRWFRAGLWIRLTKKGWAEQ